MSPTPDSKPVPHALEPSSTEAEAALPTSAADAKAATDSTSVAHATEPAKFEVQAAAPASAADAEADAMATQISCNDANHVKMGRMLMKLFHESDGDNRWIERWWKSNDLPYKHDIHSMMYTIQELAEKIKEICLVAKQSDPSLEMVENRDWKEENGDPDEESVGSQPLSASTRACAAHINPSGSRKIPRKSE